ncbi:nucleoside-diphosphate sugar epimerase/dehydratase, partial [Brevundimonas sp.]|uniref:nucleoside-diphosphate sugar epimerase/dehydratase n=1 Tax=Brevundimonas sp. TaxID=1871086 RepID=UPI003511A1F0
MPSPLANAFADDRTGSTRELDAAGLQALAYTSLSGEASVEEAEGHKRGPFRPGVWLNARERARARLSVHYFHAIDVLVVTVITLLSLFLLTPQGLGQSSVSNVLPVILGAMVTLGLMRSIDIYRFGRDTSGIIHLGTVGAMVMAGALVAVASGLILGGTHVALWLVWPALMIVSLYGLHLCWLEVIRRMRLTGALTPNVVLVGATKHAESMIRDAMQRRDLNIIGVFDDRMARSPKAVEGVPVLGDSEALMSHRILPYVDRVVLAIDPKAEERVRDLTRRLGALPNPVSLLVDTA